MNAAENPICALLERVSIPRRLEKIGPHAFPPSLQEVIPRSRHLNSNAREGFVDCSSLKEVIIPFVSMKSDAMKIAGEEISIVVIDDYTKKQTVLQP